MSEIQKPALPPRRPSPVLADSNVVVDSPLDHSAPSIAAAAPRLPPRKSGPDLPPIVIHDPNETLPANIPMPSNLDINPPTAITVTPATPSSPLRHALPLRGAAQNEYRASVTTPGGYHQAEERITPVETVKEAITAQVEAAKPYVAEVAQAGKQFEWGLITAALVFLAWMQVSLLWIILLGVLSVLWMNAHSEPVRMEHINPGRPGTSGLTREREAVTWV
jgi:hypothetical protein